MSKKEEITTYTFTDGEVSTIDFSTIEEEGGWYSSTTHYSGNPPSTVTYLEMEEVELETIPLPFCNLCGDRTTLFEPVGFCLNPEQPGKIHYFLFKPFCKPCSHIMFDWDEHLLYTTMLGKKAYRFKKEK